MALTALRYGAFTAQHGKLIYDDTQYLLALALADKAIYGVETPADLWQLNIPDGENELILRWHDKVRTLQILRKTSPRGVTEEPLQRQTFSRIFKTIMKLSGYISELTTHAIRRFVGKKIDSKLDVYVYAT